MSPKTQKNIDRLLAKLAAAYEAEPSGTGTIINNAEILANRLINRAKVPDGKERIEYAPTKGPIVEFTGHLLHSAELQGNAIEISETLSGKLVIHEEWIGDRGDTLSRVDVCEAGDHIGAMNALNWSVLARSAARKLKWNCRLEVD